MSDLSFEERCIDAMGETLGCLYHSLWQEVAWAWGKWDEYLVLFGESEGRIAFLNQVAPAFFRHLQDSLWEDVLLHIARLTDRPSTAGSANLSVQRLPGSVDDPHVRALVLAAVNAAVKASEFARDWRNRHIAHRDLALSLGGGAEPLQMASRLHVRESLDSLREVLDAVSTRYLSTTNLFNVGPEIGGATDLLWALYDGIKAGEARRQRIEAGQPTLEDLRRPSLP
jgi:hypothetical protein